MPPKKSQLAAFITTHRERAGLSVPQLAEALGKPRQTVHAWESDNVVPQVTILEPLARAINVSYEDLYALAGYARPEGLPSGGPYLRAKFPGASKRKLAEAERIFSELEDEATRRAKRQNGRRA